ncbi:MAG: choice-of-anchor D domain-containing protein, partial [Candidatus Cloacimonetes bacterium]|nr:choice-of-anchor D domain-containing protein [Candidatus Cloacimonadota bacterium]
NGICSTPTNFLSLDDITLREYIPSPVFSIDPPSWNYGMVASGTLSDAQAFIITNAGDADLIINQGSIYLSGADAIHFTLTDPNSDLIIAPQATATIYVNFSPLSLGIKTATLNIIDNVTGRNLNEIPLSGRGIGPLEPPFVMDFEEGWLDWITLNENQVNKWQLGTAAPYRNSYSAYISHDNGTTNSYSLSSSSYVHFYHDVIFPADITGWRLKFNWKSMGEAGFDYLSVHITDTSFVPVAGEYFTLGQIGTEYSGAALWQMVSLDLDPSLAGQTRRLIFSWHNDGGGGAQTPAAIDNIRIVPQGAALAIPQNVSAYASGTSAFLSWDLIPEANDYIIEHSDMFDGAFEPLGCAGNGLFSTPGSYLRRFFRILATD